MLVFRSANSRKENPTAQSDGLCYVTATFGEWLQGLPQGWTALQLVQQAHLEVNRVGHCVTLADAYMGQTVLARRVLGRYVLHI